MFRGVLAALALGVNLTAAGQILPPAFAIDKVNGSPSIVFSGPLEASLAAGLVTKRI